MVSFVKHENKQTYSIPIRALLLDLARRSVEEAVTTGGLPPVNPDHLPTELLEPRAVFVTLHKNGQLRGCIGNLQPQWPLYQAVMENARSAALHDIRFPPVRPEEVPQLSIEISVLSPARPLPARSPQEVLSMLEPGRHGVIFELGPYRATFLPQVWEQLPDPVRFLQHLSMKAGAGPNGWQDPKARFSVYEVEAFSEEDPEIQRYLAGEGPEPIV